MSTSVHFSRLTPYAPQVPGYLMTHDQMMKWLSTLAGEVTYVGEPLNLLAHQAAVDTTVVYCSLRAANVCGAPCTVYTGGTTCLDAPNTNCLAATTNVNFCDNIRCNGRCSDLFSCPMRLDNGFCFAPATRSINVPV